MPKDYHDYTEFSIPKVREEIQKLREKNQQNRENITKFINYIDESIVPVWTTDRGKEQVEELKKFARIEYARYTNYIEHRIDVLEYEELPRLIIVNQA